MATAEESIAMALGIPPEGIVGWANDETTNQVVLTYNGECGVNSENTTVLIVNTDQAG